MSDDTRADAVAAVLAEFTRPTRTRRAVVPPSVRADGMFLELDIEALAAEVLRLHAKVEAVQVALCDHAGSWYTVHGETGQYCADCGMRRRAP